MLVDIILLIFVILILYKVYINKFNKLNMEHWLSRDDEYMYIKNEPKLLSNYYNMINDKTISEEERCHNNNTVITEMQNNPTVSPKILALAKKFKAENCEKAKKNLENIHVLGDIKPIISDKYEYVLKDNNKNEPILIRTNRFDPTEKPFKSNGSLIMKVMNDVYSFNTQNNKWYVNKINSWNLVIDTNIISKLNYFVNEFLVLRTDLQKIGKKLVNKVPVFHINNDIFPIKINIKSQLYEFSILNGKLIISNITQKKIESNNQDALVIVLLNDKIYFLSKSFNWMIIENNNFKVLNDKTLVNQLNIFYNSMVNRKTLMNNIEKPTTFKYDNLYYTPIDDVALKVSNAETHLYTIDKELNSITKSNAEQNQYNKIMLEFLQIILINNVIYFKTKAGKWVTDISKDNSIKLKPLSDQNSKNIDKQLIYYIKESNIEKSRYYKAGDAIPFDYNNVKIVLQNGFCIKDDDGLLYVKFPNQEYLKFVTINRYDLVEADKLPKLKVRLENLVKRFEKFRSLGIKLHNKGDISPIITNNYSYKINNKNTIEKNNVALLTIFSVILNMGNVLYAKTLDGNWYKEMNNTLSPIFESEYPTLNMFLVKAVSLRNIGLQLQDKQQIPNLQSCSQSMECLNKNAFCRNGNNLCMFDDECNFMYREKSPSEREELCKKMPKNVQWYTLKKTSPILLASLEQNKMLTQLPNSIFDNKYIHLCPGNSIANTNGCLNVIGKHNVHILLNNLIQIVLKSNQSENIPGYVTIKKVDVEKYNVNVYSWPSKYPLADVINRSEIYKSIKNKSLDNVNIEDNETQLMLFTI